ncbi:MAG: RDD family protein [Homoserinimonas sp.]
MAAASPLATPVSSAQALVDDHELITGEAVALDLRPAGFILRAAGSAIDMVTYLLVYLAIVLLVLSPLGATFLDQATQASVAVGALVFCIVAVPMTVELLTQGRSLGKLAVGARVVRDDGGAIGFRHAFIRALVGVIEIFMSFGGIATLVGLLNTRAKRLGDLLAGTYSQHERVSQVTPPVYGVPLELVEWSKTADVARMPSGLARRIAQFLRQASGHSETSRSRISRDLANEAARYVFPQPGGDPELFLAAIAALRREREYAALHLERQHLDRLGPALKDLPHGFPDR